jgi:hypothetical protein
MRRQAGSVYQLWANGLGPKNAPEQDGVPVVYTGGSLTPLEVPGERQPVASSPLAVVTAVVELLRRGARRNHRSVELHLPVGRFGQFGATADAEP